MHHHCEQPHCALCDLHAIRHDIADLQLMVGELLERVPALDTTPARITLTAHPKGSTQMADQFPAGQDIHITAVAANAEGVPVPDSVTYTTSSGTLTVDDPATLNATLRNAAIGTVTIGASDQAGNTDTLTLTVVDPTPVSLTLSAS